MVQSPNATETFTCPRTICYEIRTSNQSRLHSPQKILSIRLRLCQHLGLIPKLQRHFLQKQLNRVFRLESLRHQLPDPRGEALLIWYPQPRQMIPTLMSAKLSRSQPVVCRSGLRIVQHGGQRIVPLALRTRPSLKRVVRRPDQLSGSLVLQATMISTTQTHELRHSRTKQLAWPMIAHKKPQDRRTCDLCTLCGFDLTPAGIT